MFCSILIQWCLIYYNCPLNVLYNRLFFYHRVYLNGVQILLENESIERFCQTFEDINTFYKVENVRTIFDIPLDAELLNQNEML